LNFFECLNISNVDKVNDNIQIILELNVTQCHCRPGERKRKRWLQIASVSEVGGIRHGVIILPLMLCGQARLSTQNHSSICS
jgi:hypothetical protein